MAQLPQDNGVTSGVRWNEHSNNPRDPSACVSNDHAGHLRAVSFVGTHGSATESGGTLR